MDKSDFSNRIEGWQRQATQTARNLGQTTDKYVRGNTWRTLAVALVVGCLVGFFLTADRA